MEKTIEKKAPDTLYTMAKNVIEGAKKGKKYTLIVEDKLAFRKYLCEITGRVYPKRMYTTRYNSETREMVVLRVA